MEDFTYQMSEHETAVGRMFALWVSTGDYALANDTLEDLFRDAEDKGE